MSPRLPTRLLAAQTDRRLVEMVAAGHERAFEVLVRRYRHQLLRYCARMGLSDSRAEDVLQHAFLQSWLALQRGAVVRELGPWLYRVVHNAALNTMRSAAREHGSLADVETLGAAGTIDSELEGRIAVRAALSDVAALPTMQREAIVMSALDGRSHREVATALGVSDGAVRGLLYRARATLRSAAAVLTPQPLLAWASSGVSRVTQSAARVAGLAGGPGAPNVGVLVKGTAVALTAAVAAGAVLTPVHHRAGSRGAPARAGAVALLRSPAATDGGARSLGSPVTSFALAEPTAAAVHRATARYTPGPATAPRHGRSAFAVAPASALLPTSSLRSDRAGGGDGHGAAGPSSSGSDGRHGGASGQEGGHDGGSITSEGSHEAGGPPPAQASQAGEDGLSEPKGSGEPSGREAEVPSAKGEREAEEARERSEHEAEEARERAEGEAEAAPEPAAKGS